MALRHKYTLICDEVRIENNGKLLVIGMYGPRIAVPQIPCVLPSLTFFQCFESDSPAQLQFRATLQHLDDGQIVAQAMGIMNVPHQGQGGGLVKFANVVFSQIGSYVFAVSIDTMAEPITTTFDVVLAPVIQIPIHPTPQRPPGA